jgi:hypothetical protein
MRNTTKLKNILALYTITLDMDSDGTFELILRDKRNNSTHAISGPTYSAVIGKAFSHLLKELKRNK